MKCPSRAFRQPRMKCSLCSFSWVFSRSFRETQPHQQGGWQTLRIQGRTPCWLAYVLVATSCRWTCCFACNVALNHCFSMQHGLLITSVCVWTTLAMLGPLQHSSLSECLCSGSCSPSPTLFISSPSSSRKGDVIKHLEKLSSTRRVSVGGGVGESRGSSGVWAIQQPSQGLWERWVPTW